ncbi:PilN domain-containing protein [Erwinia sp. JUb26]|uniref:PilN domain-containing protein n=1 Tax=Erwinia sp. JUb26 TaxID=2485126 RepID=UPI000F4760EC|nr:PilN domain-containing protein [Erwinia sp. JUb26]ROR08614.1 Tfp pilus assembly protein PilN [Erwinia sp. JUb26]
MVCINLMPWRARRQRQQWQRWRRLCGLMLALTIFAMQGGYWQQRLNDRRAVLLSFWPGAQQDAAALHDRTLAAQQRLDQLRQAQQKQQLQQQDLSRWLGFIQRLSAEIPPDIWLNGLKKDRQGVSLKGFSRSVAELHHLRDRLRQLQEIPSIKLGALRSEPSVGVSFSLQLTLGNQEQSNE